MLYEHAEWWSKKGWFVLYIKWKQTFAISPMTWGCITCRARRTMRQGMAVPCVGTYLPFFGMWQASILSQEEELLGDLEIETNPIRVFCWKTAASPSPSWWSSWGFWSSNDFMACQRAQVDLFYHWLRWLKSFTEVKTILIAQNQGASVKPCGVYIIITFALIIPVISIHLLFFFLGLLFVND